MAIALQAEAKLAVFDIERSIENRVKVDVDHPLLHLCLGLVSSLGLLIHCQVDRVQQSRRLGRHRIDIYHLCRPLRWSDSAYLTSHVSDFMLIQRPFLIVHPVVVALLAISVSCLHLKVLVQSVEALLLEVDLSFSPGIADLFVLFKFELVELCVLRDGREDLHCVVFLGCQVDHGLFLGLEVLAAVHVLPQLVGALHVVQHPVAARVRQDVEVVGIIRWRTDIKGSSLLLRLALIYHLSRVLHPNDAHWVLVLGILVRVCGQIVLQFIQLCHQGLFARVVKQVLNLGHRLLLQSLLVRGRLSGVLTNRGCLILRYLNLVDIRPELALEIEAFLALFI